MCVCECQSISELYKGSAQVLQEFSPSKSMDLSPSFSLNPTSLSLLLHIPLERMTEERAEHSVHLLNLSGGKYYSLRGGRQSGRAKSRSYEIQAVFHGETIGRKDCVSSKSARERLKQVTNVSLL